MTLSRPIDSLLLELPGAELLAGAGDVTVRAVEHDSRNVRPGTLFVAVPGFNVDGHSFLPAVVQSGAGAIVVQRDRPAAWRDLPSGPAVIVVDDTRAALSAAAAWFYGHPGREMTVVGVTGTDGKTTTSHLLTSVLEAGGARVGRLGTVDVRIAGQEDSATERMTTPEATEVQRLLRKMADAGCRYAIVESTSHGLALHRLDHVEYDIAVFTNITGDHLDFHETFEAYREAKGRLFEALDRTAGKGVPRCAVVNADDPSANFMLERTRARALRYGLQSRDAEVLATNLNLRPDGSDFRLVTPSGSAEVSIRLPAIFNVANALAAAAAGFALGLDSGVITAGLAACPGVPGRMERIDAGQPFDVIVDYAHTGDAVRKVLSVLRGVSKGRLIIVIGAAGERDPGRRFGVGRAAAEGADFAVFTNEDPRSEDPGAIVREIGRHAEGAGRVRGQDFIEVEDRRAAIAEAFRRARGGDLVLVAGKGHEKSIVFAGGSVEWDDRVVAREELAKLGFGR